MSDVKPQFGQRKYELGDAVARGKWDARMRSEWDSLQDEQDEKERELDEIAKRQGELFGEAKGE